MLVELGDVIEHSQLSQHVGQVLMLDGVLSDVNMHRLNTGCLQHCGCQRFQN